MRTNIEIDDDLLSEARAVRGTTTKKATVEASLLAAIRGSKQRRALGERIGAGWQGDLDASREGHGSSS